MVNVLEQLKDNYIFAVIRGSSAEDAVEISKHSIVGGIKNIEVTYTTPDASKAISELKKIYSNNTEIVRAMNGGAKIIKLFPGGVLGPSFIKDIHGPIPNVDLMPSGGVSLSNIKEWKDRGAVAVGVGSALSAKVALEGYESVTEIAKEFVQALN